MTGLGDGIESIINGVAAGINPARRPRFFDPQPYRSDIFVELAESGPARYKTLNKRHVLKRVVTEALAQACLSRLPEKTLIVHVGQFALQRSEQIPQYEAFASPALDDDVAFSGAQDSHAFITHACASAAIGVTFAREWILSGCGSTVLVLGASLLNKFEVSGMDTMRALSRQGCRPFDIARDGVTIGEGGGAVLIKGSKQVESRGFLGSAFEIVGAHTTVNAESDVALDADAVNACIMNAIEDAKLRKIDIIHAHATGTAQGDASELRAIESAAKSLRLENIPVSSHKGSTGHLLHASGLAALGVEHAFFAQNTLLATAGLANPEPAERLYLFNKSFQVSSGERCS